jgi:hypothetical protein
VSADSSTTPTGSAASLTPVPERAAAAILGSMILLILLLVAILVQTTWVDPGSATDMPLPEPAGYAQL